MESILQTNPTLRRLAASWLLLALAALACSTLCAVLLIAARTPLPAVLGAPGELFRQALVLHVALAVLVWFLSCGAAFWTMAAGAAPGSARWAAPALAAAGLVAMLAALVSGSGQPVLANYVPVLDHPLFLAGLVLFIAGVTLCGSLSLLPMLRGLGGAPAWRLGALLSLLAALVALGAGLAGLATDGRPASHAGFEQLAWGPGHVLQFVHVILLMSAWTVLAGQVLGRPLAPPRVLAGLLLLAALPLLAVPVLYLSHPHDSAQLRRAFTLLMAFGCWPAPALLALRVLQQCWVSRRAAWATTLGPALALSALLFLLGCLIGSQIRADSTMVPAHYHGTVGAVTLAYMALGYHLLPAFGAAMRDQGARRQLLVYGTGLATLALALAWSGTLGVPRKTMHVEVLVQYPAYLAAMSLAGLGGLLAICGAAWFVANMARAVAARAAGASVQRDVRWRGVALTAGLTAMLGMALAWWPPEPGTVVPAQAAQRVLSPEESHALEMRRAEIARRFGAGVALLNARQYEEAATELHRVLALAPQMPEAHVNMGYALLGAQKFAAARDFFTVAIDINPNQLNAYFGLAVALEGTGDMDSALGAMRSYVHLCKPGDPYLRKAEAAIWEWENARASARGAAAGEPRLAVIPENGKTPVSYPIVEKRLQ